MQGIGGAALFATALALIGHEYRGREFFSAIAVWGATIGAAVASGPLVGGLLTDGLGWRWVFFVNVPVGCFALFVALRRMVESRDEGTVRTDIAGLVTFSAALFLIVFGLLRGNTEGWTSALILSTITAGVAMLVLFVIVELTQQRPMLDMSLFRQPAFVGVSLSTFAIGAGMFAMFPYLSIYLQDVLGMSPLGAGLRFLPLTVFVFVVPLATRNIALRSPAWLLAGVGLVLVAVSLFLMYGVSASSHWTTLLAGFVVGGIGIGLANPTLAAAALRVVDPARSGMASGFNNTCRLAGVAIGVAGLGAVLEHAVGNSLATNGHRGLAQAVSSSGENVAHGQPLLAHLAAVAFAHGLNAALITGCIVVAAGAISAFALMRMGGAPVAAPEAAASSSSAGA